MTPPIEMTAAAYRATLRSPRRSEEADGQAALFDLLARLEGRWPLLAFVTHVQNESSGANKVRRSYRKKDGTTGYKMVPMDVLTGAQQGVKPGVPDIVGFLRNRCPVLHYPIGHFVGFTIERKAKGGIVRPDQARWAAHLWEEGWYAVTSTDWTDEVRLIIAWCGGDVSQVEGL